MALREESAYRLLIARERAALLSHAADRGLRIEASKRDRVNGTRARERLYVQMKKAGGDGCVFFQGRRGWPWVQAL